MTVSQFWAELLGRSSGPMHFRIIIQPVVAGVLASIAAVADAKAGRPAFLWTVLSSPAERRYLLKDGWSDIVKLFCMACVLDIVYQIVEFHALRPLQTLVVATVLAVLPYVLLRGPVGRLVALLLLRDSEPPAV